MSKHKPPKGKRGLPMQHYNPTSAQGVEAIPPALQAVMHEIVLSERALARRAAFREADQYYVELIEKAVRPGEFSFAMLTSVMKQVDSKVITAMNAPENKRQEVLETSIPMHYASDMMAHLTSVAQYTAMQNAELPDEIRSMVTARAAGIGILHKDKDCGAYLLELALRDGNELDAIVASLRSGIKMGRSRGATKPIELILQLDKELAIEGESAGQTAVRIKTRLTQMLKDSAPNQDVETIEAALDKITYTERDKEGTRYERLAGAMGDYLRTLRSRENTRVKNVSDTDTP